MNSVSIQRHWNRFFHAPVDPAPCALIRIGFAFLLLINNLVLTPDLLKWYGPDGVLPLIASRMVIDSDTLTLFQILPETHAALLVAFGIYNLHAVCVLIGWRTRLNCICLFIWLVSFQHRNLIILDGEDTVFRLIAFLLIFMPAGAKHSVDSRRASAAGRPSIQTAWALRLLQLQMSLIYLSTAILKFGGSDWRDGTALYYVIRLDDLFGRFPIPLSLFESLAAIKVMTWTVLVVELALPVLLWIPRTKLYAVATALLLHLLLDYSMNLFLFQWIMIVGLLSFVSVDDIANIRKGSLLTRWNRARS